MLFDKNNPIIEIVDVIRGKWRTGPFVVAPREYSSLAFRTKGKVHLCDGSEEYIATTNDILFVPQHFGYTAEYDENEGIVIHFITQSDETNIQVFPFENGEKLYKMFLHSIALWDSKEPGYEHFVMAQLYEIMGSIVANQTKTVLPEHFLRAISIINTNYKNSDLNLTEICHQAGISPTVFRQLFRQHYQKTPLAYITDLRLSHARQLISVGSSVENAAYESGFNDSKYFARVVKKHLHCTPKELKSYGK